MSTPEEWLEAQAERISARQRSRADTAKLVATFAAGIAGGLVASALQTGGTPSGWDWASTWGLVVTVVLTVGVVISDRMTEPDHGKVLTNATTANWDDGRKLIELRLAAVAANYANEQVIRNIQMILSLQVAGAMFTGATGAYSMLSATA